MIWLLLEILEFYSTSCRAAKSCVTKYVWKRINDSLEEAVDSITLKELVEQSRSMQTGTWTEE